MGNGLMGAFHWRNISRHLIVLKGSFTTTILLVWATVRCEPMSSTSLSLYYVSSLRLGAGYLLAPSFIFIFIYASSLWQVTEQIYVGSCIQTQADVENLSKLVSAPLPYLLSKTI